MIPLQLLKCVCKHYLMQPSFIHLFIGTKLIYFKYIIIFRENDNGIYQVNPKLN